MEKIDFTQMPSSPMGQQRTPASTRLATSASLSVVVVSSGSVADGRNAVKALQTASRDYQVQLIFVSRNAESGLKDIIERTGTEFVAAPAGCTRAEMCDIGMSLAKGAIVAVRDDTSVGNAHWMDVYRSVLPIREVPQSQSESVVMDTLVASRAPLADVVAPRPTAERSRMAAEEVTAAV